MEGKNLQFLLLNEYFGRNPNNTFYCIDQILHRKMGSGPNLCKHMDEFYHLKNLRDKFYLILDPYFLKYPKKFV
jgi:hypothetical protein